MQKADTCVHPILILRFHFGTSNHPTLPSLVEKQNHWEISLYFVEPLY
jgi:hypothetical protein